LGFGGGAFGPTPQAQIPNPQSPILKIKFNYYKFLKIINY
jgi:hypothetical protein